MKNKSLLAVLLIIGVLVGAALIALVSDNDSANSPFNTGGMSDNPVDIIGTHSGTSTSPVAVTSSTSTNSYIWVVGRNTDQVDLNILASTTGSGAKTFTLAVEGSNDQECNTTNTSTSTGETMMSNIRWHTFNPSYAYSSGVSTVVTATSSAYYTASLAATTKTGFTIQLKDLNVNCLRFTTTVASTSIYMSGVAKQYN